MLVAVKGNKAINHNGRKTMMICSFKSGAKRYRASKVIAHTDFHATKQGKDFLEMSVYGNDGRTYDIRLEREELARIKKVIHELDTTPFTGHVMDDAIRNHAAGDDWSTALSRANID
jgi:hypothetical protein